jgi:hypothetical protein
VSGGANPHANCIILSGEFESGVISGLNNSLKAECQNGFKLDPSFRAARPPRPLYPNNKMLAEALGWL